MKRKSGDIAISLDLNLYLSGHPGVESIRVSAHGPGMKG